MELRLMTRMETAGNDKIQLQFSTETDPNMGTTPGSPAGVTVTGWIDRGLADTFVVGNYYILSLTPA